MTPTMPPSVQHRNPAPASPAAPRHPAAAVTDAKPEATKFRQELVRQRKEKTKTRDAAEASKAEPKKAVAKPSRSQKARKGRTANPKGDADRAETDPMGADAVRASSGLAPRREPTPIDDSAEDAGGLSAVDEPHDVRPARPEDAAQTAGAMGVSATAQPGDSSDVTPTGEAEGEATGARSGISALSITEAQSNAALDDVAAAENQVGALDGTLPAAAAGAEGSLGPAATGENAKPQPAGASFGQALAAPSQARAEDGDAEGQSAGDGAANGGASNATWMQDLEAAAGEFSETLAQDDPAATTHPGRAALTDPSASPALDLSAKHVGTAGTHAASAAPTPGDTLPPEARFAAANHENIVKGMHAEVLPNGGTMRIRLDPPQLGALQVTVHIRDGVVTASFETSNDEATRLLGHSLNQLKSVLESHGVGVDRLQVQQAPRDEHASAARDDGSRHRDQTPHEQEHAARQEQQRKEMLRRMWRRLSGGVDPLDVTV